MLSSIKAIALCVLLCLIGNAVSNPVIDVRGAGQQQDQAGAVASESSECSQIGIDLLRIGGNAADAMAGTVLCVGVIGMYHSGIGGGGFMLVRSSSGSYEFIDFRETAPAAAFEDMYKDNINASLYGGLASGVPGELRGLQHLHDKYGRLPWSKVVSPAVHVARYGFRVTQDLVRYMHSAVEGQDNFLVDDPSWAIDFAPNGTMLKLGDTIYRKRYANTLETIAQHGPDAFYEGAIAQATIQALQNTGGTMTLDDLKNYSVVIRDAARIRYKDYILFGGSAPCSGETALAALNTLGGYPFFGHADSTNISTYVLNEALRFAYAQRANLGDPAFLSNITDFEKRMLSPETAAAVRQKITATTHNVSYYNPDGIESLNTHGTSGVVTADSSGMAISLTTTVNLLFGSQVIVPETGVIMNDEMNDFSVPGASNAFGYRPSPANYIRPGKRPLSSISPLIAEFAANHSFYFTTGAAGGSRIITSTIQNFWHALDQNMTSAEALAQPRLHDQLSPNVATFEYAYDNSTVAFLASRGVNVSWIAPGESTVQALRLKPGGSFEAAGDPRQKNSKGLVL